MTNQRRIVTLLRWVMFLALGYLIWASGADNSVVQVAILAIVAASNIALSRAPLRVWEHPALLPVVAVSDIGVLTASMAWGQGFVRDFFFAYFVLLAVVAMAGTLRWAAVGTTVVVATYGALLALQNGDAFMQSPELIGRLGFLFTVGVGYGGLMEAGKLRLREAAARGELVGWVAKLTRAFAEEFDAHDLIRQLLKDVKQLYPGGVRASVVQLLDDHMVVISSSDDQGAREMALDIGRYPELAAVIASRAPVAIDNIHTSPLLESVRETLVNVPFDALLLCPVTIDDPEVGSIILRVGRRGGGFSPAAIDATSDVAEAIGVIFRQAKMREAVERSQRLETVSQVTNSVAHSFNDLLSTVLISAEVLRKQTRKHAAVATCDTAPCDEEGGRRFEAIELAVREGMTIVDRLAAWSRLGRKSSSDSDNWETIDSTTLLQEAWTYARPQWIRRRATRPLELELQIDTSPAVRGNAAELREVLLNLMVNAIDAMPKGGTMTLALREEKGGVSFSVSDTGIGMSEEQVAHMFDPLFTTKGNAGTGLGLTIARSVARRHEGDISVNSAIGVGTEMAVWLPATETGVNEVAGEVEEANRRVLLIERNDLVRDVMVRSLETAGLDVDSVSRLVEAEVMLENRPAYAAVLADELTVVVELADFLETHDAADPRRLVLYSNGELGDDAARLRGHYGFGHFDRSAGLAALSQLLKPADPEANAA